LDIQIGVLIPLDESLVAKAVFTGPRECFVLYDMSGFYGYLVFKMSDGYGWLDRRVDGWMDEQVDRLIGI
jgi:hypothetical protein